ncbi:MAG TPA: GAF domain-containing protein, partial [Vicinamibacteria bacterium]|nr:GAF domain-containing protein [Vicinamibacteria bacterium]
MKASTPEGGGDLYRAYLTVSGDAIARFELDEPLPVDAPEDEQVDRLARHSRIAECNDIFAQLYDQTAEAMEGRLLADFMPQDDPGRHRGFREFVRARYRLVQAEEMHTLSDTYIRWVSGSALGVIEQGRLHSYWLTLTDVTDRKRAEEDRERRGHILEAVAFGAARLVEPGPWRDRADEVLARLGQAAEAGRVYIGEAIPGPGETTRIAFRFAWATAGLESPMDDPRLRDGFSPRDTGLSRLEDELRAGRPVVTTVEGLAESEQPFLASLESKSLAVVPIFANGVWWGLLGFGETRYVRQWSSPEVECLKAAAAVFGTAIERERSEQDRERRDRILEAVAFSAAQMLEPGTWQARADEVLERLGRSADAARILLMDIRSDASEGTVAVLRHSWQA